MHHLSGKWAGENPLNVDLPKAKAKRPMYYCSSNEHIMQSKLNKHLSNNMEKKYYTVGSVLNLIEQIVETETKSTSLTHIYMTNLYPELSVLTLSPISVNA